jgi:hypothetical protein
MVESRLFSISGSCFILGGAGTWRRVLDAVKELERTEPRGAVH